MPYHSDLVSRRETPQTEPIPGETQVQNNAGGYVHAVDKWARLRRWLILGSDGGTYYVSQRTLTRENAAVVEACLAEDARSALAGIISTSDAGRAPSNEPAILALALAAAVQRPDAAGLSAADIRAAALEALPRVCRIPTHLFHFLGYIKGLRGWGRGLRRAVADWYGRWTPDQLAYELVKYQARDGWAHRDVLRLAHPHLPADRQAALRWAVGGIGALGAREVGGGAHPTRRYPDSGGVLPDVIMGFEAAKAAAKHPPTVARLIRQHGLTREMVPTEVLNSVEIWAALLEKMPLTAMIRNLGKMSAVGLLAPLSDAERTVAERLADANYLQKSRVHPLAILNALRVYASGHGEKGSLTWAPAARVVDALDVAFYASFGNVAPSGKRLLLALDVSASMDWSIVGGTGLSCREACAALALVTANVEQDYLIGGFTTSFTELAISPRQRLDDVTRYLGLLPYGGTDCALPMLYASAHKLAIDGFVVYTDNETWAGQIHPKQALRWYRDRYNPRAASVVVGMTATKFSIADPADPRSIDVVGFDLATPQAISEFIAV